MASQTGLISMKKLQVIEKMLFAVTQSEPSALREVFLMYARRLLKEYEEMENFPQFKLAIPRLDVVISLPEEFYTPFADVFKYFH